MLRVLTVSNKLSKWDLRFGAFFCAVRYACTKPITSTAAPSAGRYAFRLIKGVIMKILTVTILSILMAGCLNPPKMEQDEDQDLYLEPFLKIHSSGFIGCAPNDITTSELVKLGKGYSNFSWRAVCKGKVFYCSSIGNIRQISCKEKL